jgi:hypothetical protein
MSARNPLSSAQTIANVLLARQIVDSICANVVDHPDTWRQLAINEIALHLDVAGKCRRRGIGPSLAVSLA